MAQVVMNVLQDIGQDS